MQLLNLIRTKNSLLKNNYYCEVFEREEDCLKHLSSIIEDGETIGIGGSVTIDQLGIYDKLKESHEIFWHWKSENKAYALEKAKNAHTYITGSNAITEEGFIYNIDGNGNRVSSIAFGHKKVIIIVGRNKIVRTIDDAVQRTRNIAAPNNAKRLNISTPCAIHNKCMSCHSENKICNIELLLRKAPPNRSTYVLIINKDLGY